MLDTGSGAAGLTGPSIDAERHGVRSGLDVFVHFVLIDSRLTSKKCCHRWWIYSAGIFDNEGVPDD